MTFLVLWGITSYYYVSFSAMIELRLAGRSYENASRVFTAPRELQVGEAASAAELGHYLRQAGYSEAEAASPTGSFRATSSGLEIRPGAASYFEGRNPLRVDFSGGKISALQSLDEPARSFSRADMEPELLTSLFDQSREKRRSVRFEDLPEVLVKAVLAAEDKRFFEHPGFDPIRIIGAAWADLQEARKAQGASTITMQAARSFFFTTERAWSRKLSETFMALLLEHRFSKRRIFELYANQVYLGNRGSFAIRGFGEAARSYFGKDVRDLTTGEACFLAGIIRSPNRYVNAELEPERAREARDRVLSQMQESGLLSQSNALRARREEIRIVAPPRESSLAACFVDMVKEEMLQDCTEEELLSANYDIYTTLDLPLQRAAAEALEEGLKHIDDQLAGRPRAKSREYPPVQGALVALDPRTGAVRALVGGRDYGRSQFNRALARRQPGSVFKPFVYAVAFDTAIGGVEPFLTPATLVVDEPTTFHYAGKEYTPDNYGQRYSGSVTLREALVHSLNVATVKTAELAGLPRLAQMADRLGISGINPTPSAALGAYEMTPLEVAGAYTVFACSGKLSRPVFMNGVRTAGRKVMDPPSFEPKPVLDPRVAFLITSILEDVLDRGTGAIVRSLGFTAPAGGKTGTSRDGWFAGYTSSLLCVVWVGFDDNRELGLAGSASAAPIWTDFMKRAMSIPRYDNVRPFDPPDGITAAVIDPASGQLATDSCPTSQLEFFLSGTEPREPCRLHGGNTLKSFPPFSWLSKLFGGGQAEIGAKPQQESNGSDDSGRANEKKKKSFLQRIIGIFRGGGDKKP